MPETTCYPCGAGTRPTDDFCEDGLRAFTCAGVCKMGGDTCPGDMPICSNGSIAICNGGTWDCDSSPNNQCLGSPPFCQNGAFCYGGEWYCGNNTGCTGSAPYCCSDGSSCPSNANPLLCCPDSNYHQAVCNSGVWRC